jgi:glycosyltransferase involved in cell wall biosynthesis
MNIFIYAGSLAHTQAGAAHATLDFANALAATTEHQVFLYTTGHEPGAVHPAVHVVRYSRPRRQPVIWRMRHLTEVPQNAAHLRSESLPPMDVCYTQGLTWGLAFRRVFPAVPVISHTGAVISERERIEELGGSRCPWYVRVDAKLLTRLEKRSYAEPRWAHVVSTQTVARQRAAFYGVPERTFTVCPYGLSLTKFDGSTGDNGVRQALGIASDAPVLITVSRLTKWKNTDMLLRAFARCGVPDAYLIVAGDGVERQRLETLAGTLGISSRVRFTGHVDPAPYYAAADVFALPSQIESFGIVYGEAMLMKLPCIGLRSSPPDVLSAAEDVIDDGETGFCVSSEEELAARITLLLTDTQLRHRMGEAGLERARRRYSCETYVAAMLALMRDRFRLPL